MKREPPIRVLVIDDSAANRREISAVLESAPGITVVDRASDGDEGLQKAVALKPDVVTLDLEMPRLDGFTFLRLLKATARTPVIVLSSYAHPSDVFKALELGAFDFVPKPAELGKKAMEGMWAELIAKVRSVRELTPEVAARPSRPILPPPSPAQPGPVVVAVGASTGGPPAIQQLVTALKGQPVTLLIAQHMPARFTQAFAERLDQLGALRVSEARGGDRLRLGAALVAPGGSQLELVQDAQGSLSVDVRAPSPGDRHAPSVDRLFTSVARVLGPRALGVVLTGMGDDGVAGVRALGEAGGEVWAESQETAVIFGMPRAAIQTGVVKKVLGLKDLAAALVTRVASPG